MSDASEKLIAQYDVYLKHANDRVYAEGYAAGKAQAEAEMRRLEQQIVALRARAQALQEGLDTAQAEEAFAHRVAHGWTEKAIALEQQIRALLTRLREESDLSMREADRYAAEGNQEQKNRAIGLAAARKECADELEILLTSRPEGEKASRCDGRYPVPQTAPPRAEPYDVTYRCALPVGHDGPHGTQSVPLPAWVHWVRRLFRVGSWQATRTRPHLLTPEQQEQQEKR